jgi:trigger factor
MKQLLGKKIRQEIAYKLVEDYLGRYVEENKINVVPPSELDNFKYDEQNGLSFTAKVEVEPEIELTKFQDFEFEKEIIEVDDVAVAKALENLQDEHGVMNVIETEAQANDYVVVDMQQVESTGIPIIGQKFEDDFIHLDTKNEASKNELINQLIGAKTGETRHVILTDVNPEAAQPETLHYQVKIKEVKSKTLPNLDDEFAKDMGNYQSLDELKAVLRKRLEGQAKQLWQNNYNHQVMNELVKANPIDFSEKLIEFHLNYMLESVKKERKKGQPPINETEFKQHYRADTIWNLKWRMIRDKIQNTQNLTVEDSDFEAFYNEMATLYNADLERVRNRYLKAQIKEDLKLNLMEQKVIEWVVAHSKLTETRKSYNEFFSNQ